MQVRDNGEGFSVLLTKPESKTLDKAAKILHRITGVACPEQVEALAAKEAVMSILTALAPAGKGE